MRPTYPKSNVIAVAATDAKDHLAPFPNFGPRSMTPRCPPPGARNAPIRAGVDG